MFFSYAFISCITSPSVPLPEEIFFEDGLFRKRYFPVVSSLKSMIICRLFY